MLHRAGIKNFKPFQSQQNIVGKPITLIYGPNSGGKSSIIQSLMLLKQSVENQSTSKMALSPRGDYVDLGSFRSMVHQHDMSREISFELSFDIIRPKEPSLAALFPEDCTQTVGLVFGVDSPESSNHGICKLRQVNYKLQALNRQTLLDVQLVPSEETPNSLTLRPSRLHGAAQLFTWKTQADRESFAKFCLGLEDVISTAYPSCLTRFSDSQQGQQELSSEGLQTLLSHMGVVLDGPLPSKLIALDTEQTQGAENALMNNIQFRVLEALMSEYSQLFSAMSYLGPLRSYPARYYVASTHSQTSVGKRGEHTAQMLFHSPAVCKDRINEWFEKFEIPYSLSFREIGDEVTGSIISLILQDHRTGVSVAPSDVGFGIGQLLPILVEGMASHKQILCVEQPEIHLHPRLQAHLADFFIETSRPGSAHASSNQWLIETHSEALVLRLQRRIREGVIKPEDISILYVQPGKHGSQVLELSLDEEGHFLDEWPDGFFEESYDELFGGGL